MSRIGLFFFCVSLTGCQGPGLCGFLGPTRVPAPPTGVVGNAGYDSGYDAFVPRPDVGQGASSWPSQNWQVDNQPASEPSPARDAFGSAPANALPPMSSSGESQLDANLQANWADPLEATSPSGLRLSNGPSRPLVTAPPRIRGFRHVQDNRAVYVPQALAQLRDPARTQAEQTRQASAYSNWQPRYGEVRR